jgi:hypothetical protein
MCEGLEPGRTMVRLARRPPEGRAARQKKTNPKSKTICKNYLQKKRENCKNKQKQARFSFAKQIYFCIFTA